MEVTYTIFAWIGGILVTLAVIGTSIALIRGSYTKARVESLSTDNKELREKIEDLRGNVSDLEHQHDIDQAEKQALSERVSHVENENDLLKQLVTQRADVEKLATKLDTHHEAAMTGQDKILEAAVTGQNRILTEVRKLQAS